MQTILAAAVLEAVDNGRSDISSFKGLLQRRDGAADLNLWIANDADFVGSFRKGGFELAGRHVGAAGKQTDSEAK